MIQAGRERVFARRWQWLTVIIALVLGLGAGFAFFVLRPYTYESETTIYVAAQTTGTDPSAAYNGTLLSQEKVKSYVELLTDSRLTQDVAQRLGGGRDAAWVAEHLSASSPTETAIIRLVASDGSGESARALATAGAESMLELIADIERPADPAQEPPVVARLVRPATFSDSPVSPVAAVDLGVGAILGLLVGLAAVGLHRALDRTVRSAPVLAEAAGAPVLGLVPRDPRFATRPLPVRDDRHSAVAEAFRKIRTNLLLAEAGAPARVLLVTAPRYDDGATTTAGNLALALAATGRHVLLVGADLRAPSVERFFADDATGPGLADVLRGALAVDLAVRQVDGLDLLLPGKPEANPGELLAGDRTADLVRVLRERYDHVVVDAPPVLPLADAAVLSSLVDATILVARYGRTTTEDVETAAQALRVGATPVVGTVLSTSPAPRRRPASAGPRPTPTATPERAPEPEQQPDEETAAAAPDEPEPSSEDDGAPEIQAAVPTPDRAWREERHVQQSGSSQ